ncbi:MAG TPA: FtsQ-type POTRA domain-containing protein [Terrimesophilobacter sp.]|nr:FtsQ-type POTRA domain-containing protein [Terrimesophilobacter sp.]
MRRFTKRTRAHRAVWLTIVGTVTVMAALLAVAVFSPLLSFERLVIRGAVAVDESAVRAIVEEQLGSPLALLDHDAIRAGLAGIPLIRSFTTELTPPNTLTIHVVERQPIGALRTEAGFAIVDPAGVVLSRVSEQPEGLPRIVVDSEATVDLGFAASVEVLLALPPELRANVDTSMATTRDDVRLTLRSGGESVVWGSADRSELKARVLARLLAANPAGSGAVFDVSAPMSPVVRSQ